MLDLRAVELPMYRPDRETPSEAQRNITADVEWADAFVLATPDYHGSMSGAMKNFLDYHWEELAGKVFGYICSSHEKGLTVMDQMRTVVRQCYGWSMPYGVAFDGRADFGGGWGATKSACGTAAEDDGAGPGGVRDADPRAVYRGFGRAGGEYFRCDISGVAGTDSCCGALLGVWISAGARGARVARAARNR